MTRIVVASEMAVVAVSDASLSLPSAKEQDALLRELEPLARAGQVFYLVADDPVHLRLELLQAPFPAGMERDFEPSAGTFGLQVPSGRLAVHGWDAEGVPAVAGHVEATPGPHALSVLARRHFDAPRHAEDMAIALGPEWAYMRRVEKLGLVGCLPLAVTLVFALAQRWQWLLYLLPLLLVSWVPYLVLRQGRRYKAAEARAKEHEQARPHYVLSMVRTESRGLAGGFLRA